MDKIIYKLVYNRKKTLNGDGTGLVQVEAYLRGKKKYFSTRVYLKPEQWDARKRQVVNHPNAGALNHRLYDFMVRIERQELDLWQQYRRISLDLLKERLLSPGKVLSFTRFYEREVTKSSARESTKRNQLSTLAQICLFRGDVQFGDLSFEFLTSFEHFLRQKGLHTNTIAKHMKHLKRMVNIAIDSGYMDVRHYPFRKYRIKTVEHRHTHLAPEELEKLECLPLEDGAGSLRMVLDAFLFCCYAGLRYSDFTNLSPADNIVDIRHERWLVYRSLKTGNEVRLPLYLLFEGKGLAILDRYKDRLQEFFHLQDNSNVNKKLRILGRMAGVNKRISFHTARHTNATLLIYKGVNITTVQHLLGHRSVRTTQGYAGVMDRTIVRDLEKHV